jgi:hypothetical protein
LGASFIEPAERAWARARTLLFRPLDVERWLVIGFAAFLSGLAGRWAGISVTPHWRLDFARGWNGVVRAPFDHLADTFDGQGWILLGVPLALAFLALGLALLWIGSRGKLIFLDNMVRGRAAFVEPWKHYGRLGDSLFLWRLGFSLATLLVAATLLAPMFVMARGLGESDLGRPLGAFLDIGAYALALALGLLVAYIALFLECFVIPLMIRHQVTAAAAWKLFVPLLRARLPEFLLYGIVVLLGLIAVFLCLIALAVVTCCVLPVLLSVPYLRSVLLLPLSGFFRLYSVEFLEQFGPQYALHPVDDNPGAPPPGSSGASEPAV